MDSGELRRTRWHQFSKLFSLPADNESGISIDDNSIDAASEDTSVSHSINPTAAAAIAGKIIEFFHGMTVSHLVCMKCFVFVYFLILIWNDSFIMKYFVFHLVNLIDSDFFSIYLFFYLVSIKSKWK